MPRSYDIIAGFGLKGSEADQITLDPGVVMAFYRQRYAVTYSRKRSKSFTDYLPDAAALRDDPYIVVNDVFQLSVSGTKSNHVTQMNASLYPGSNYLSDILPGDFVFVFMAQDQETVADLVDRLKRGKPCNGFKDGLKFFGKVAAVRKQLVQQAQGLRTAVYRINAAGFTELDASIYYEPYLGIKSAGLAVEMLKTTGTRINQVISENGQGIAINKILPVLLQAFYGNGVPENKGIQGGPRTTAGLDNPNSFVIPSAVGSVFGVTQGTKPHGLVSFADLMDVVHGIQKYDTDFELTEQNIIEGGDGSPNDISDLLAARVFTPDGINPGEGRLHFTGKAQLGTFLPQPTQYTGQKTVWSILTQYLNPTVNEIYTSLRLGPDGVVMPTLTIRQLPFSSGILGETYYPRNPLTANNVKETPEVKRAVEEALRPREVDLTRFTELPRWKIHPVLIKEVDIGRSDSLRFNFINVQGETGLANENKTAQIIREPPIRDELDIVRSGLRPYIQTVNCGPADVKNHRSGEWMYILSDILMGQHLTLTGTMTTYGIQAPIAVGDNIEFDKTIFHIEALTHQFNVSPAGTKTFITSLALSHGVNAEQSDSGDLSLYTGIKPTDLTTYDPDIHSEDQYERPESTEPIAGIVQDDRDVTVDRSETDLSPVLKGEGGKDF